MSNPEIIEEESMTMSELKDVLNENQKRDGELNFRAGKTVDHLNHINLINKKKREELVKKVTELEVPRLKPFHIHKIVDIMPSNTKELNVILSGYTLTVNKQYQEKIIEALTA